MSFNSETADANLVITDIDNSNNTSNGRGDKNIGVIDVEDADSIRVQAASTLISSYVDWINLKNNSPE